MKYARLASGLVVVAVSTAWVTACQRKDQSALPVAATPAPSPAATAHVVPTAAAEEGPPAGVLRAYVWQCDDGRTFTVRNLWRENAVAIDLHDGTHKLLQERSASGVKYADGNATFWTRDGEAMLEASVAPAVKCHELRARSLIEDARMRGVLYRGLGNEPGWTIEVGPGNTLVWVTAYGNERHEYANALAGGDAQSGLVYTAADAAGQIKVMVRPSACNDDMSGEAFDLQVVVTTGGRDYRGCGSKL